MKAKLFLFFLFLIACSLHGQVTVKGQVMDRIKKEPIEFANVFIANTTIGTTTDKEGRFELKGIKEKSFDVVVSYIGYGRFEERFTVLENKEINLKVKLSISAADLTIVKVVSIKDKKHKHWLKQFNQSFFGETTNSRYCKLLNPEVLTFSPISNGFSAKATDLLVIENKAIGYRLHFALSHFEKKGGQVTYSGKPYFEVLKSVTDAEKERWMKNRTLTYLGSKRHFLNALRKGDLVKEGFLINHANQTNDGKLRSIGVANRKYIFKENTNENILTLNGFLEIIYTKEKDDISKGSVGMRGDVGKLGQAAEQDMIQQESSSFQTKDRLQISYLYLLKNQVEFQSKGIFNRPELVQEYGYWGYERIADLLPLEYEYTPSKKSAKKLKNTNNELVKSLNGFSLSALKIPLAEIKKGGPPRDGIPAIDNPQFIKMEQVNFLSDKDKVLGVTYNGVTKAYPIKILDLHEIVNDNFGNEAIVVTYCPLCGSGMSFKASINGELMNFGVSGLLYNSDVLLYDRTTESLWSQIMGQAVAGKLSGTKLEYIQTTVATWKEWKNQHSSTLVLSMETGFNKDYNRKVYQGYEQTERLMFPVAIKSTLLPIKARIIGIQFNGKYKAYPFSKIKKKSKSMVDEFADQVLTFEQTKGEIQIKNQEGELIPYVEMYWFAWYAFHPETEVFQ